MNTRADSPPSPLVNDEAVPEVDEAATEVTEVNDPLEEPPEAAEVAMLRDKPPFPSTTTRPSPLWELKCINSLHAKMRNQYLGF